MMNPQQSNWLNDKSRPALKKLGFGKDKPKSSPELHDKSMEGHEHADMNGDHAQMHAEHGPVVESSMKSDHEMQMHNVMLKHQDGHVRHSEHDSHGEAMQHMAAAHEPMEHSGMDSENDSDEQGGY